MTDRDETKASGVPNVFDAIGEDLGRERSEKRRHFVPAIVMAGVAVLLLLLGMGTRVDLWSQPPWRLALQCTSWVVCLVLFPAIGVGLWFPSRNLRWVLGLGGAGLATLCALGWPLDTTPSGPHTPCAMLMLMAGLVLLGIGALSGAFSQRRARSSVFWIAGGLAMAALASVTWICPNDAASHVSRMHLGPAVGLAALAGAVGVWLHKRFRRRG